METFTGLAVGAAAAVLTAVLATLTFTPALLGFIGHNINRLHIGRKSRQRKVATTHESSRWAEIVQRRPKLFAISGIATLLVLAIPIAGLELGSADSAASAPVTSTNRIAYDTISRAFGPGYHGPIMVVVDNPSAHGLANLTAKLRNTPGIVSVDEPTMSPDNAIATFEAVPSTAPDSRETITLLKHVRDDVIPSAEGDMQAHLGGNTALSIDFAQRCGSRLPWFIGTVLLLSFLMLMTTFRSVVIPLKAVLLNLLSLSAAGGLLVAMFQWGWAESLFGFSAGPVEPWIPELLFAIVFGLSMDYEIFLLTSIREARELGHDNASAVSGGLGTTARIITAAAIIMTVVFASFVTQQELAVKMIGFGLASAIALDATIVRLLIMPAVMTLLGEANWWMPKPLERLLPAKTNDRHEPVAA